MCSVPGKLLIAVILHPILSDIRHSEAKIDFACDAEKGVALFGVFARVENYGPQSNLFINMSINYFK